MASKLFLTLPSGQKMPALGLGTFDIPDQQELETAIDEALRLGYRHIDTAWLYGSEPAIGRVIKKWISSGKLSRKDLFITTKLPMTGVHPARLELLLKQSLERLQLDYVDLYLIHFPVGFKCQKGTMEPLKAENGDIITEPKTDHAAIWKKMEEQVDAGRVKNIGLSNYSISQIQTVLDAARIKPANLQIENHVYFQQQELVDFCQKNGISVTAYMPFASPTFNDFLVNIGQKPMDLPDVLGNKLVGQIAKKHGKTPAQVALRFLLQRNIAAIPRSTILQYLTENIDLFDFELNEEEMKSLYGLEVGERARVADFQLYTGTSGHPDWPFSKKS